MFDIEITTGSKSDIFEAKSGINKVSIELDKGDKIRHVRYFFKIEDDCYWNEVLYPREDGFDRYVKKVFEVMMYLNTATFKSLLRAIKETEPGYYEYGRQLLFRAEELQIEQIKNRYSFQ